VGKEGYMETGKRGNGKKKKSRKGENWKIGRVVILIPQIFAEGNHSKQN
jgi:hypothetical protein